MHRHHSLAPKHRISSNTNFQASTGEGIFEYCIGAFCGVVRSVILCSQAMSDDHLPSIFFCILLIVVCIVAPFRLLPCQSISRLGHWRSHQQSRYQGQIKLFSKCFVIIRYERHGLYCRVTLPYADARPAADSGSLGGPNPKET
jgi:hypothetical protein